MSWIDRLQMAVAALRGVAPIDLPASGRSSEETLSGSMGSYLAGLGTVSPVIDFDALRTLHCFSIYNPDFAKYVSNMTGLGNPGHSLAIDAANDAKAEAAVNRLNEAAVRLYPQSCGVDGLIDRYITDIAWSGAVSSEDVVNLAARRVEKVVMVPVEDVRFRYDKERDEYLPYQRSTNLTRADRNALGLIKLNTETYKYFALSTVKNSPYAKPPATAVIEAILEGQKPIMDNIQWIAKKFGILGLVAIGVAPIKQKGGETDAEYATRYQAHLAKYAESLSGNFNKGLIVMPKPNTIDTTTLAAGGQGLGEVETIVERQVISGMGGEPAFFGRSDSTTETFADVVFYLLKAQVQKFQRVAKRRMEATYRLDLRLGGLDVDGVSLQFNKAHSRNAKEEAETEQLQFETVLQKIRSGAISPVEGANELGLDGWFDEERLMHYGEEAIHVIRDAPPAATDAGLASRLKAGLTTIRLSFDKRSQRYVYRPEQIRVSNFDSEMSEAEGNVIPIKKKAAQAASN